MTVTVLYQDAQLLVCLKPVGVTSEGEGLPRLLTEQLQLLQIYPVHRLDTAVGGVMVYALTPGAAAALSGQAAERTLDKRYLAVCAGCPEPEGGEMRDLLFKDSRSHRSYVVDRPRRGVKEARLTYRVGPSAACGTLVAVRLHTGRTHQIRVQFASRRHPLLGDGKYGSRDKGCTIALWSHALCFTHPCSGQTMRFSAPPPGGYPWDQFTLTEVEYAELSSHPQL